MPRHKNRVRAWLPWWPVLLACGCELVTDFSPESPDAERRDDGGTDVLPDGGGDMSCTEVLAPCPPGMVHIPCGNFLMGAPDGGGAVDEHPEHIVKVSSFCIDQREVSNAQYAECVRAGACAPPYSPSSATRATYYSDPSFANYPVLYVDWDFARTYCAWVGKRLPSEAEWEKAARGGCETTAPTACDAADERWYPWGNEGPACPTADFAGCTGDTDPVDAHVVGASPYAVEDAAGNVAEWTADWYAAGAYGACATGCTDPPGPATGTVRTVRGGSWNDPAEDLRVSHRTSQPPAFASEQLGFRCAATIP